MPVEFLVRGNRIKNIVDELGGVEVDVIETCRTERDQAHTVAGEPGPVPGFALPPTMKTTNRIA